MYDGSCRKCHQESCRKCVDYRGSDVKLIGYNFTSDVLQGTQIEKRDLPSISAKPEGKHRHYNVTQLPKTEENPEKRKN